MTRRPRAGRSAYGAALMKAIEAFTPNDQRLFDDPVVIDLLPAPRPKPNILPDLTRARREHAPTSPWRNRTQGRRNGCPSMRLSVGTPFS
jgi:hypothetical protein